VSRADVNRAEMAARAEVRHALTQAQLKLERLRDSWNGTLAHLVVADEVVAQVEAALADAKQLAALCHAAAASHHSEAARPELQPAIRRWA
jgi:hypothetical protein